MALTLQVDMVNKASAKSKVIGKDVQKMTKKAGADVKKLERKAVSSGNRMSSAFKKVSGALGALGLGLGIGIAIHAIKNMITSTIQLRDSIAKMSKATGVSVEFLSSMGYVAERAGGSFESLTKGIKRLLKNMGDVEDGLAEAQRLFVGLGIRVTDSAGEMRKAEDVFMDIAGVFGDMTNEAKMGTLALELFGRAGLELVPLLREGKAGIQKLRDEAERLGVTFDIIAAQQAEEAADALTRFGTAAKGLKQSLAMHLIPVVTDVVDGLNKMFFGFTSDVLKAKELKTEIKLLALQIEQADIGNRDLTESMGSVVGGFDKFIQKLSDATGIGQTSNETLAEWKTRLAEAKAELELLNKKIEINNGLRSDTKSDEQMILDIRKRMLDAQNLENLTLIAKNQLIAEGLLTVKEEKKIKDEMNIALALAGTYEEAIAIASQRILDTKRQQGITEQALLNLYIAGNIAADQLPPKLQKALGLMKGLESVEKKNSYQLQNMANSLSYAAIQGENLADSIEDIGKNLATKAFSMLLMSLLPGGQALGGGGFLKSLLGFQHGGTVPGPIGQPRLAVVHGGERITPANQITNNNNINIYPQHGDENWFRNDFVPMFNKMKDEDRVYIS